MLGVGAAVGRTPPANGMASGHPAPLRLFVVDREPVSVTAGVLLQRQLDVVFCVTASEALRRASVTPPTLALVGTALPDWDGITFARVFGTRLRDIPIVVIVEETQRLTLANLLPLPIAGVLVKPVEVDEVVDEALAALAQRGGVAMGGRLVAHVGRAAQYIACHYQERLGLDRVAKAVGISPTHLAHLFKAGTGCTVGELTSKLRIELARALLERTDDKLSAIAHTVGFADAPHFSRTFRRYVGSWPGGYRHRCWSRRDARRPGDEPMG